MYKEFGDGKAWCREFTGIASNVHQGDCTMSELHGVPHRRSTCTKYT